MTPRPNRKRRAGFALLLVVGFNVVLLAVWGVAYRSVGAAYRVEMMRSQRKIRDAGTMTALGMGVALLQTGTPTNSDGSQLTGSETYVCYIQLSTNSGPSWFAVIYTPQPLAADGSAQTGFWSVQAYPVDTSGTPTPTMPGSFATT